MFKLLKKDKAFTLIEMLVAILIFSIIIGAATGVFASAIKLQRYNLVHQQLLDQTSYAMEYMSRAIRMAQKDKDGSCIQAGSNYEVGVGTIKFETYHGQCWEFSHGFSNSALVVIQPAGSFRLTSENMTVSSFIPSVLFSNQQPRVTIFMEVQGNSPSPQPRIKIQTTISQRNM